MYTRIKKSDNEETILKSMSPYRYDSSGTSTSSTLGSAINVPIGTITIPIVPDYRKIVPNRSKQEDFEMLLDKHKNTLNLLAK